MRVSFASLFTISIVTMYGLHVYNFYSYHAWVTGLQFLYRGYMVLICTTQVNLFVTCILHVTICISQTMWCNLCATIYFLLFVLCILCVVICIPQIITDYLQFIFHKLQVCNLYSIDYRYCFVFHNYCNLYPTITTSSCNLYFPNHKFAICIHRSQMMPVSHNYCSLYSQLQLITCNLYSTNFTCNQIG